MAKAAVMSLRDARLEARRLGVPAGDVRQISDIDELLGLIDEAKTEKASKRGSTRTVKGTVVKRGRGRPKGSRNKATVAVEPEPVVKRGPGRPRKVVEEVEETPRKRRGRPPGSGKKVSASVPEKRKPGRPKKAETTSRVTRGANGGQVGRPSGTPTGTRTPIADELDWSIDIDFRPGTIAAEILGELYNQVDNNGLTDTTEIRQATIKKLTKKIGKEPFVFRYGRNGDEMDEADAYKMLVYRVNRAIFDFAIKTGQHKSTTVESPAKRRGRPPKAETVEAAPKRGRGRPAKATQETPKRRGRPPGSRTRATVEEAPKRRGRPPGSKNKPKVEETPVRRGPGRPPKATTTATKKRGRPRTRA